MLTRKNQNKPAVIIPLTIVAGAVIGSALTLLFAPKKGNQPRQWIKDKASDLIRLPRNTATEDNQRLRPYVNKGNIADKVKLHEANADQADETNTSKAVAMVNHLKHSVRETGNRPEPS